MYGKSKVFLVLVIVMGFLAVLSCSKEGGEEATESESQEKQEGISFTREDVNFGVFFDEEATKRTIVLEEGQTEFDAYIVIHFPEDIQITAAEYRLVLPEGVEMISDRFYEDRVMLIGTFDHGISESFTCVWGPKIVLHILTLRATKELENAEIAIMPSKESDYLGVAKCQETFPKIRASSYRAVINPVD